MLILSLEGSKENTLWDCVPMLYVDESQKGLDRKRNTLNLSIASVLYAKPLFCVTTTVKGQQALAIQRTMLVITRAV